MNVSSISGSLPPGFLLAGRYRVESQLGQGGFGLIYKARDLNLRDRFVAVKQISLRGLSPQEMIEATDTYNREVTLLSMLKHDHLPGIHDRFTDPEHWYVVMDYIDGETLEDILSKLHGNCLPIKQVIDIGIALCDVLHYLHSQRPSIIFRDVKPANIMITREGRLYLIDFGIARQYRAGQARDTGALGSPGYAAPEQYGRAQTSVQTDIYGLGATLQTLLTGKDPLDIAVDGMPADHPIPRKLKPLITQMLERDAVRRPRSMEEVKAQLLEFKNDTLGQKMKQGLTAARQILRDASGGMAVPILLFALFILVMFDLANGFNASPIWLPCVLSNVFVICLYLAVGFFKGRRVAASNRRAGEIALTMWEHLLVALFISSILTLMFYFLQDILQRGPMWPLELPILIGGVCAGIIYAAIKVHALIRSLSRAAKPQNPPPYAGQAKPIVLQQQIRRHTWF